MYIYIHAKKMTLQAVENTTLRLRTDKIGNYTLENVFHWNPENKQLKNESTFI